MIVAYVTSHGFGHAVRTCEVLRRLPASIPLTLRTTAPRAFLTERLGGRPFRYEPAAFDCGTLGPDSRRIDVRRTVEAAEGLLEAERDTLEAEARRLRALGARLVWCDAPALPLAAAAQAGIPSVLLANFTWSAIYRHLLATERPAADLAERLQRVIERFDAHYARGDLLLIPGLEIPMAACRERRSIGLIARPSRPRRAELARALDFDPSRPIYLVYLGREGMADLQWDRAERLRGLQLAAYGEPPPAARHAIRGLPEAALDHADAAASVDGVIGKAGYGICAECIAAGTPLAYPPRPQFAEMLAVERTLAQWGGGVAVPEDDFRRLEWRPYLEQLASKRRPPAAVDCGGAARAAALAARAWTTGVIDPHATLFTTDDGEACDRR